MSDPAEVVFIRQLNQLITAVRKAQQNGTYNLEEAAVMYATIKGIKENPIVTKAIEVANNQPKPIIDS